MTAEPLGRRLASPKLTVAILFLQDMHDRKRQDLQDWLSIMLIMPLAILPILFH